MYLHTLIHTYTYVKPGQLRIVYTVNVERFTGLNIHGFSPMRSLWEYFCGALASSVYYSTIAKENFHSTLTNHGNRESLVQ